MGRFTLDQETSEAIKARMDELNQNYKQAQALLREHYGFIECSNGSLVWNGEFICIGGTPALGSPLSDRLKEEKNIQDLIFKVEQKARETFGMKEPLKVYKK